ncbi:MAG: ferrochelatase [Wolbachia endosymbiont of Fragariocoptes setiger]|nr:ferrochelatase [Wolbachia endosymbiont of Fragariocoptes setiger]
MKKAIVLFNLGGPSSIEEVKTFLFNLFYDKRIINISNPFRFLLAKFISSRREKTAQDIYKQIGGKSPILQNTEAQAKALEQELNKNEDHIYKVFICMRYSAPFVNEVIQSVKGFNPEEIILLPLYPQYSTTTTLSSIENWQQNAKKYDLMCNTRVICCYYNNQYFIEAYFQLIKQHYEIACKVGKPRILFSAHGLPLSIVKKGDPYSIQVEESAKLIVDKLAVPNLDWSVCYQSKIGPVKWLEPSTEHELLRAKVDDIPIVLCPISFVSEHSETLVELDIEYKRLIKDRYYFRVPTVSINHMFIKCLASLCKNHSQNDCIYEQKCQNKCAGICLKNKHLQITNYNS